MPIKKIVILETIAHKTPEELAELIAPAKMAGQPVPLTWANGVVFFHNTVPPSTDKLMDEFTRGIIYWQSVHYSLMKEYKPIITARSERIGQVEVAVMDVSNNENLVEAASWLKGFR